jgi:hypothetical protein
MPIGHNLSVPHLNLAQAGIAVSGPDRHETRKSSLESGSNARFW